MADREGFVARWSRLKRTGAAKRQREEETASAAERPADAATAEQADAPAGGPEEDGGGIPDLPPIESLNKDSDFTAFMRKGVPEELKRLALRKLWTSDPVLANLDGLLEYGEDFSKPFKAPGLVATLYRVGEGMPAPVKEIAQRIVGDDSDGAAGGEAPDGAASEAAPAPADSPAADPEVAAEAEDIYPRPADPDKSDATS